MAKNDFDIDFDFEKEYGFDPKAILDSDFSDEDLDLSQFDEKQLSIDLSAQSDEGDFDFSSLNLGGNVGRDIGLNDVFDPEEEENLLPEEPEDEFGFGEDLDAEEELPLDFDEEEPFEEEAFEEEFSKEEFAEEDYDEDLTSDMDFSRRASFFEASEEQLQEGAEMAEYPEEIAEGQFPAEEAEIPASEPAEDPKPVRRRREPVKKEREPIKLTVPPVLKKIVKLYFPTTQEINPPADPNDPNPKRRRKKSKLQIFKEFYLPTIIAGLAIVLMLSFVIGSLGNAIERHQIKKEEAEKESIHQESEAERVQTEAASLLTEAERLASGYHYQGAIDLLNSFTGDQTQFADLYQQISTKKAEYTNAKSQLVEHKDPSTIPNLSFHVLMADPVRAFADKEFGGLYNRNFVSTDEFEKILDQLYVNGFVLVDYDSFVSSNEGVDSTQSFFPVPILLPEGKKPVMITETMVNYFDYMVDSNDDGEPDAGGAGFASRLVVTADGSIKAELVDTDGSTKTGNYDLVPILEDFIAEHPDFSYQGARATLAVTGSEGIFGYRINSSYVPTKGQSYVDDQIARAKEVVQALREKGYNLASYTYANKEYLGMTAQQIQSEMANWTSQVTPVLGAVDTIVFARESDLGDYTGNKFEILYNAGFRIFVKNGDAPYAEVNTSFVKQTRLMVTGNTMAWKSTMFTNLNLFDPNLVLNSERGNVPNG